MSIITERQAMKKFYILIAVSLIISMLGCEQKQFPQEASIEEAVADFYKASYDYERIKETYNKKGIVLSKVVKEGQVYDNPYKEHEKVVLTEPKKLNPSALAMEVYYKGNKAYISTNNGFVKQSVKRSRVHGYGEKLTFKFDRKETIESRPVEVYVTQYTYDLSKFYKLDADLTATITQEYYMDEEKKMLIKIITDVSDLNKKNGIAIDMSENGAKYQAAIENANENYDYNEKITLIIKNYGTPTKFDMP